MSDDPLRLRRADRRAERRQVDADQRAGRREGVDRLAQGADDARDRARHRHRGAAQMIFVDTPGLFAPKRRLDRAMVAAAWGAAGDADVLALLIDAQKEAAQAGVSEATQTILERCARAASRSPSPQQDRPGRSRQLLALAARLNAALASTRPS